jgi:hypothetical protein
MKNLQRKALPDLTHTNKQIVNFLKLVTDKSKKIEPLPHEIAEEFLFELDRKIEKYKAFMENEIKEGIKEIFNQEFQRSKCDVKDIAWGCAEQNNEDECIINIDSDGQPYYNDPTILSHIQNQADEIVEESYLAIAVESYKLATGQSDIL